MLRSIVLNQVVVGYSIWLTNGDGRELLAQTDLSSALIGLVGAVPIVLAGRFIEKSDKPVFAELNSSTNMLVLRLFGDKPQRGLALVVSALIALLVATTEETVFRGVVTNNLYSSVGPLAPVVATILFAIGHINPTSISRETLTLFCLQLCTGGAFATLALLSGGLAAPIAAHACYDFYTFYETHLAVTGQLEYAFGPAAPGLQLPPGRGGGVDVDSARRCFMLMDTNRDGKLQPSELRIALYSYGIKTSDDEARDTFDAADADGSGGIDFGEFVDYVKSGDGDASKAFKRGLLGGPRY